MNQKFPSSEKLKSKSVIDRMFTEGKSLKSFPLRVNYLPLKENEASSNKMGVSVPKRNFKKAVDRNYLKRLIREAYRKNKYLTANNLNRDYALMFIYISREKADLKEISTAVIHLLKQLIKKEKADEKIDI